MIRIMHSCEMRLPSLLPLVFLMTLGPSLAGADIHRGVALITPGSAWDFSDSATVVPPNGDLRWVIVAVRAGSRDVSQATSLYPYFFVTDPPAQIAIASQDSTFEELTSAPTDPDAYVEFFDALEGYVYIVRTQENHYAKLIAKFLGNGITIEYVYQDDGSRRLVDVVSTDQTTWGRIKNLYKR